MIAAVSKSIPESFEAGNEKDQSVDKLRLPNFTGNSCFLIAIVNFLHGGDEFVKRIHECATEDIMSRRTTFISELSSLFNKSTVNVARLRSLLSPEMQDGPQDVFDALWEIMQEIPAGVRELFEFDHRVESVCPHCEHQSVYTAREKLKSIQLYDDVGSIEEAWKIGCQDICDCRGRDDFTDANITVTFPPENKYLLLHTNINNVENPHCIKEVKNGGIVLFDIRFTIRAAVEFQGTREEGHFVAWHRRDAGGYVVIDDNIPRFERCMPAQCRNFVLMLLERMDIMAGSSSPV